MAKSNNMKDLLKQRMSAAQQVSEMEIGNRAYESLIDPLPAAASTIRELPVDKLRPFSPPISDFTHIPQKNCGRLPSSFLSRACWSALLSGASPTAMNMRFWPDTIVPQRGAWPGITQFPLRWLWPTMPALSSLPQPPICCGGRN